MGGGDTRTSRTHRWGSGSRAGIAPPARRPGPPAGPGSAVGSGWHRPPAPCRVGSPPLADSTVRLPPVNIAVTPPPPTTTPKPPCPVPYRRAGGCRGAGGAARRGRVAPRFLGEAGCRNGCGRSDPPRTSGHTATRDSRLTKHRPLPCGERVSNGGATQSPPRPAPPLPPPSPPNQPSQTPLTSPPDPPPPPSPPDPPNPQPALPTLPETPSQPLSRSPHRPPIPPHPGRPAGCRSGAGRWR